MCNRMARKQEGMNLLTGLEDFIAYCTTVSQLFIYCFPYMEQLADQLVSLFP